MDLQPIIDAMLEIGVDREDFQFQNNKEESVTLRYKYWKFLSFNNEVLLRAKLAKKQLSVSRETYDDDDGIGIRYLHSYKIKKFKIYCFDLDDTISKSEKVDGKYDYKNAKPIPGAVEKIRQLKDQGHKIIILTARHMLTCNGDVELVEEKMRDLTENWLKENKVYYDELIFGKPYADVYVDDKAFKFDNNWEDLK